MQLYSYVVRYDIGFAPNPFHGWCTLATCKQDIRARANVDDWIVGTGSQSSGLGNRLVYAMRVEEIHTFDAYWNDSRFFCKRPNLRSSLKMAYGDNIYHHGPDGGWQQADSRHSFADGAPNPGHIERDTKANRVLVSRDFVYYGGQGPIIPERFSTDYKMSLVHRAPSYRVNFPDLMRDEVIRWIRSELDRGLQADPYAWGYPRR